MRRDLIAARRNESVREAAAGWRKAKLIDGPVKERIDELYPDDRHRKSNVWRALIFFFTCVFACALLGFVVVTIKPHSDSGIGMLFLFAGAVLVMATEIQLSGLRFDGVGSESATSFLAIASLSAAGLLWLIPSFHFDSQRSVIVSALTLGAICVAAAWRWGYPLYALTAAISLLVAVVFEFEGNRPAILLAGLLLTVPSELLRGRSWVPLSHRISLDCISGAGLAAIYATVNRYSLDLRLIEQMVSSAGHSAEPSKPGDIARLAAAAATTLLPPVLFAIGIWYRRRLLFDAGLVSAALSLVTLRQYVHLGPTWLVLCESGVALTVAALLVERYLRRSPGGESAGFTAAPEISSGGTSRGVEVAAVLWNLAPSAAPAKQQGPIGGGGSFGGGGATGDF